MNLRKSIPVFFIAVAIAGTTHGEADRTDWQRTMLFAPTPQALARAAKGEVFIYDGLHDSDIEKAMATEFDRIGGMMFVRTRVTDSAGAPQGDRRTGDLVTEEDDCD